MSLTYSKRDDITAMIVSIINANAVGQFSVNVATDETSDKRFSDEYVRAARRASAARVIDAIGSNPRHPFWSTYATKVAVNNGDSIPACFGEIGVPEIRHSEYSIYTPNALVRTVTGVTVNDVHTNGAGTVTPQFTSADVGQRIRILQGTTLIADALILTAAAQDITFSGNSLQDALSNSGTAYIYSALSTVHRTMAEVSMTVDDFVVTVVNGDFTQNDVGRRIRILDGATLLVDSYIQAVTDANTAEVGVCAPYTVSDCVATVYLDGDGELNGYETGYPASATEIDSYRSDVHGLFTNPLGEGAVSHDEASPYGLKNPIAGKYSTENGYIKFTGYACRIPMIQVPDDGGRTISGTVAVTNASPNVVGGINAFTAADIGKRIIVEYDYDIVLTGIIQSIATTTLANDTAVTDTSSGVTQALCQARTEDAALSVNINLLDDKIPLSLAPTVVRLAVGLLIKEGDSLRQIATMYFGQGEVDLVAIRQGASSVSALDVTRAIQTSQRYRQ